MLLPCRPIGKENEGHSEKSDVAKIPSENALSSEQKGRSMRVVRRTYRYTENIDTNHLFVAQTRRHLDRLLLSISSSSSLINLGSKFVLVNNLTTKNTLDSFI